MDISLLERNAKLGVYDFDESMITNFAHVKTSSMKSNEMQEKLRKQLREDCILAAISAGCTRKGSKQIFAAVYEMSSSKSNRDVAMTMIDMIRKVV